jgi:hypothetical protein
MRQKVCHFGALPLLFLLIGFGSSCCCFTEQRQRGTPITIEEAKEEMPFALYLPTHLPSYVDPNPQIFRVQYESSLPPNVEIYYTRKGQDAERVFMIFATRAGSSSRTHYATSKRQLILLADGSLAVDRSASLDNSGVRKADLVKGPPYQTCLWWDLGSGEEKAWYTIYSTLSLTETLEIVDSMESVP